MAKGGGQVFFGSVLGVAVCVSGTAQLLGARGAIMHCYSGGSGRYCDCFRSKYRNLLDFVFGTRGGPLGPGDLRLARKVGLWGATRWLVGSMAR